MPLSQTFFLHIHNINTMPNIQIRPVRKIKENKPLLPYASLTFILLLGLSKYNIQVLNPVEDLLTSQQYRHYFVLLTSIKCFFQSPVRVMRFQKMPMPGVNYFSTIFQLYVVCVFFTDGACMMTLNTITTEIPICWKVINGTKKHCMHQKNLILKPIKH